MASQDAGQAEVDGADAPQTAVDCFDWTTQDYKALFLERARRIQSFRDKTRVPWRDDWVDQGQLVAAAHRRVYERDPTAFIQDWGVTYDPRRARAGKTATVPFVLFPKQREFLGWVRDRWQGKEYGITEKSREVGVTWLCVGFAVWLWLFHPGTKVSFGSRKEAYVDKKDDPDSILEKVRIMLRNLPAEILPVGFDVEKHAAFMRITNPENGATITGEAGNNIGRGGRSSIYFVDEAAHLEQPEKVDAALANNTNVRIDVSTPNGMGNPFYRKRMSGRHPVFTFHWRDDPRKDEDWYAHQKKNLEPHILAQEVDLDYSASLEGIVIPGSWVEAAKAINGMISWPIYRDGVAGLDVGGGGASLSVFVARFGPLVDSPRSRAEGDTTQTAVWAMNLARTSGVNDLNFDVIGVGAGVGSTLEEMRTWDRQTTQDPVLGGFERRTKVVRVNPINVGEAPSDTLWPDDKTSKEKFQNLKAELWWLMRDRFQKTYEKVLFLRGQEGGADHPPEELIALPNDDRLCAQLSLLTWQQTSSGKIAIESKKQLASRGVPSPDFAEALALTFVPEFLVGRFRAVDLAGIY